MEDNFIEKLLSETERLSAIYSEEEFYAEKAAILWLLEEAFEELQKVSAAETPRSGLYISGPDVIAQLKQINKDREEKGLPNA